jgi:hypothetical protein
MEQLIDDLTFGNVYEVKTVLASVAAALAVYQLLLIAVFAFKIAVIRWWHGLGRLLPLLGTCVFVLLALTWLTSAGHFLGGGG